MVPITGAAVHNITSLWMICYDSSILERHLKTWMGDVLSILLDLGKWPNSFPAKGEGRFRLGWALEALIGVGVGKTDQFVDWGNGEGTQEERFLRVRSPNSNNHTNMWLLSLGLCGRLPQQGRQRYLVTLSFHLWLSLPGVSHWILFFFSWSL